MAAAERTFQELAARLDYPMFIATVATDGERAGSASAASSARSASIPDTKPE